MLVLVGQFTLGVFTPLYAVPLCLGVLHQAGAFVLFAAAVFLNFRFIVATKPAIA